MSKWHGRNKSNKQNRFKKLHSKTISIKNKEFKHELPIIYYCKNCKFETEKEGIFRGHICDHTNNKMEKHNLSTLYKCYKCNYKTFDEKYFTIHKENDSCGKIKYQHKTIKSNREYKCKNCNYISINYNELKQHYNDKHKKQSNKNNLLNLEKEAKKRLEETGSVAYAYQSIRKLGTYHENIVKNVLIKNKSYFEFQPIVFSKELQFDISPDFIIFSWNNKKFKEPFYLEVDGDGKNLTDNYQIIRTNSLKKLHPILRIYNKEVNEKHVKTSIKNFIFKNVLFAPV